MRVSHKYISAVLIVMLFVSCTKSRLDIDVSDIELQASVYRFDKVIFETKTENTIQILKDKYAQHQPFIDLYTEEIIRIGNVENEKFDYFLKHFTTDTVIAQVADEVMLKFIDFTPIQQRLEEGLKHFRYYFPSKELPGIYTYVSGFNQSMVVAEQFIGINLDKYLGSDCIFYQYLGIPQYKIQKMYPQKIISDFFYALAITEFPNTDPVDNLLSNMIYQGKMIYFTEAMNPDTPDSVLIGYSGNQLNWCKHNEGLMWAYWAEKKLLYSVERLDMQKFIGDAPFTNTFGDNSPGRTGVWTGWQIVRSYMNKHPEVSLEELMNNNQSQEILSLSGYFPD